MALAEDVLKAEVQDLKASQAFQNEVLRAHQASINLFSEIIVNHEARIKSLELESAARGR